MKLFQSKKVVSELLLNLSDENNLKQTHTQNSSKDTITFVMNYLK